MQRFNALVPMKKHSERVHQKNLRSFCGRPLFHQIVLSLLDSYYIDKVYINTDSAAIAQDALQHFAPRVQIIKRPPSICGDLVSMNTIIKHDLSQIKGDYFLQTHSTNPLLQRKTIDEAIETFLRKEEFDSLFGVNKIHARFYDKDGVPINHKADEMLRSQDLDPIYEENSNIYLFSRESFLRTGRRIGSKPYMFPISRWESMDIDIESDFLLAEGLAENKESITK